MRKALLLILLLPLLTWAAAPVYPFETPQQEARFLELSEQLRCLVCQGQSISDSNSDLAEDLRAEVHRMILEGKSDAEIIDFMVSRYGDFVLFKPPLRPSTYFLWFGPFVLLILGLLVLLRMVRQRRGGGGELSATEQARVRALLDEEEW